MDTECMFEFFAMGNEHLRTLTLASAVLDAIRLACVRVISLPFRMFLMFKSKKFLLALPKPTQVSALDHWLLN